MSRDLDIDTPADSPSVFLNLGCLAVACVFKQSAAKPSGVVLADAECLAENSCLVPATRVRRVQAISFDLAKIEDGPVAIWKAHHASGVSVRLASATTRGRRSVVICPTRSPD